VVEPAARVAQPPTIISTGNEVAEDAITIAWQPPPANIDGSTPVNVLGYNVYRIEESDDPAREQGQTPLNSSLVAGTQFADKNFKFGDTYRYIVRSVSLGTEGAQVESLNSNVVSFSPRDRFEPSAPTSITRRRAGFRFSSRRIRN
jgi:hypothetical protein